MAEAAKATKPKKTAKASKPADRPVVVREVQGDPGGLGMMAKAALPGIPGLNLLPGIARSGTALPALRLVRNEITVDRSHVSAYAAICGFTDRDTLPFSYPHMLAFGLHTAIMTDATFPFPAIGTVHLANSITQHRPIHADEKLTVSAEALNLRAGAKGRVFDMVTTVTSGEETVWESTSEYLRLGGGDKSAQPEREPLTVVPAGPVTWALPADLGRRYAAVSGDHNPIHLYPLTAKALGFRRHIAHGMWSKARCIAALENRIPEAARVYVEFKKPVFLPGKVAFGARIDPATIEFSLTKPGQGAPHLVGRATPL